MSFVYDNFFYFLNNNLIKNKINLNVFMVFRKLCSEFLRKTLKAKKKHFYFSSKENIKNSIQFQIKYR